MNTDLAKLIDEKIRDGQITDARQLLNDLKLKQIPEDMAVVFSSLARRARLFRLALRILNPRVHPKVVGASAPTAEELIEYASSLRGVGAGKLSYIYLDRLDKKTYPQRLLHQSFCLFMSWDYDSALPLLREYVKSPGISDYQKLIGQVNLASAFISCGESDEALNLLDQLMAETEAGGHTQLNLNCRELLAQVHIKLLNRPDKAFKILHQASKSMNLDTNDISVLFARKWLAVSKAIMEDKVTKELVTIRSRAIELRHWETVRDIDLYCAFLNRNHEALQVLYVSTPFQLFRQRILHLGGNGLEIPDYMELGDLKSKTVLILETGQSDRGEEIFTIGSILHRLLIVLLRDRYKPVPMAEIFTSIYDGEVFDPESSINRVIQLISRFRRHVGKNRLPIEVEEHSGSYFLKLKEGMRIRTPSRLLPLDPLVLKLNFVREAGGSETFESSQVENLLQSSRSSVQRFLSRAEKQGLVELEKKGRSSFYKIVS